MDTKGKKMFNTKLTTTTTTTAKGEATPNKFMFKFHVCLILANKQNISSLLDHENIQKIC